MNHIQLSWIEEHGEWWQWGTGNSTYKLGRAKIFLTMKRSQFESRIAFTPENDYIELEYYFILESTKTFAYSRVVFYC